MVSKRGQSSVDFRSFNQKSKDIRQSEIIKLFVTYMDSHKHHPMSKQMIVSLLVHTIKEAYVNALHLHLWFLPLSVLICWIMYC